MFIYNLSIKVNKEILLEWLQWQREEHIPEIMQTGLFIETKFFELLEPGEEEASTFIIQYYTDSRENYNKYINEFSNVYRQKAFKKWGDNFTSFRTLLQTVH